MLYFLPTSTVRMYTVAYTFVIVNCLTADHPLSIGVPLYWYVRILWRIRGSIHKSNAASTSCYVKKGVLVFPFPPSSHQISALIVIHGLPSPLVSIPKGTPQCSSARQKEEEERPLPISQCLQMGGRGKRGRRASRSGIRINGRQARREESLSSFSWDPPPPYTLGVGAAPAWTRANRARCCHVYCVRLVLKGWGGDRAKEQNRTYLHAKRNLTFFCWCDTVDSSYM